MMGETRAEASEVEDILDDHGFHFRLVLSNARTGSLLRAIDVHTAELSGLRREEMELPRAEALIYLLGIVAREPIGIPDDVFMQFATFVIELLGTVGATGYGRHDEVVKAIDAAIERFERVGASPIPLLLAKATFVSFNRNESRLRLQTLQRAVAQAKGDELFLARYWMAWYYIDASRYRLAVRLCDRSMQEARELGLDEWLAVFLVNRGIVRYTTLNSPSRAQQDLESAVMALKKLPQSEAVIRSLGEGLHYLGRLAADRGNVAESLRLYVEGKNLREVNPYETRATAYYHVRMAETLLGARNQVQAMDHLSAAEDLLDRIRDTGSARVSLHYARANYYADIDESSLAIQLLNQCVLDAEDSGFSRGRLMALARLCTLNWQQGNYRPSVAAVWRAVPLLRDGELRRNSLLGIASRFQNYKNRVVRPYSSAVIPGSIFCPCGMHGV